MTERDGDWKRALSHGDEVFWNDPDDGLCSRMLHIRSIHWQDDNVFVIECMDGSVVQGFAGELSGVEEY